MILTDLYIGIKDETKKTRYDVVSSTGSYDYFEHLFINKKPPNAGGLSFYIVDRPVRWGKRWERQTDKALTKANKNITSIVIPDPAVCIGFGDVDKSQDAMLFKFTEDWKRFEIYIARGQKNNKLNLYQLAADGELDEEMNVLRGIAQGNKGNK